MTTLERPPEEEKELHEYISAFIVHAIITFLTFTGMFLRDKKQKTSCPKKKKQGKNIDHSFVNFIPRPKEKTPVCKQLQHPQKLLDNGQVNLLT